MLIINFWIHQDPIKLTIMIATAKPALKVYVRNVGGSAVTVSQPRGVEFEPTFRLIKRTSSKIRTLTIRDYDEVMFRRKIALILQPGELFCYAYRPDVSFLQDGIYSMDVYFSESLDEYSALKGIKVALGKSSTIKCRLHVADGVLKWLRKW